MKRTLSLFVGSAVIYSFFILFLFSWTVFAHSKLVQAPFAETIEKAYNKSNLSETPWRLIKEQAFEVSLNTTKLKSVVFAPFDGGGLRFALLSEKGDSTVLTFPKSELAVTGIFAFTKILAVSFKDLNADGTLDIFVMTSYFDSRPVQGEGVGGGSVNIGFAFVSEKDQFKLLDDCGEVGATLKDLMACVGKMIKK